MIDYYKWTDQVNTWDFACIESKILLYKFSCFKVIRSSKYMLYLRAGLLPGAIFHPTHVRVFFPTFQGVESWECSVELDLCN